MKAANHKCRRQRPHIASCPTGVGFFFIHLFLMELNLIYFNFFCIVFYFERRPEIENKTLTFSFPECLA